MKATQYTPGPWFPPEHDNGVVYAQHNKAVATTRPVTGGILWPKSPDEQSANARLIAAAPELVEALRDLLWHAPDSEEKRTSVWFNNARAALSKAGL